MGFQEIVYYCWSDVILLEQYYIIKYMRMYFFKKRQTAVLEEGYT